MDIPEYRHGDINRRPDIRTGIAGNGVILSYNFIHTENRIIEKVKRCGLLGNVVNLQLQLLRPKLHVVQISIPIGNNVCTVGINKSG